MKELQRAEIPQYIRRVQLSAARRPVYYKVGDVVKAKKYSDRKKYDYVEHKVGNRREKFLTDLRTGQRVLKNPKAAGTPKLKVINGQGIYDQSIQIHTRDTMMKTLKQYFTPFVEQQLEPITGFPIRIYAEIHDTVLESNSKKLWDLDNRFYMYQKAFQDVLVGNKVQGVPTSKVIIPDDNILFITQAPAPVFIPVENTEDRKLVFILAEEEDERILGSAHYREQQQEAGIPFCES